MVDFLFQMLTEFQQMLHELENNLLTLSITLRLKILLADLHVESKLILTLMQIRDVCLLDASGSRHKAFCTNKLSGITKAAEYL